MESAPLAASTAVATNPATQSGTAKARIFSRGREYASHMKIIFFQVPPGIFKLSLLQNFFFYVKIKYFIFIYKV